MGHIKSGGGGAILGPFPATLPLPPDSGEAQAHEQSSTHHDEIRQEQEQDVIMAKDHDEIRQEQDEIMAKDKSLQAGTCVMKDRDKNMQAGPSETKQDAGLEVGPLTRQRTCLLMQQRKQHESGKQTRLVPLYIPAAIDPKTVPQQTASSTDSPRINKRRQEEDKDSQNLPEYLQQQTKEARIDQNIDSMANGIASMTIRGLHVSVRTPEEEDPENCCGYQPSFARVMLHEDGLLPVKGSAQAAGYDVFARCQVRIPVGQTMPIPLGFSLCPGPGTYAQVKETSSWAMEQPDMFLRAGVIDPDYHDEVCALITYTGPEEFGYIDKGEKVGQLVGVCFRADPFQCVSKLPDTGRGVRAGFKRTLTESSYGQEGGRGSRGSRDGENRHWAEGRTEEEANYVNNTTG